MSPSVSTRAGTQPPRRRWLRRVVPWAAAAAVVAGVAAPAAQADQELQSVVVETLANARTPDPTLAGAHPDFHVAADFVTDGSGMAPLEEPRTIRVQLPPGMLANPRSAPMCSRGDFRLGVCPASSQIGVFTLTLMGFFDAPVLVTNVEPGPNEAASFGISALFGSGPGMATISATVTPDGGYAIKTTTDELFSAIPITGFDLTLWGVPGDHPETGGIEPKPFFTNGTDCGMPQVVKVAADSWQTRGAYDTETVTLPALTGCDSLGFQPSINVQPESRAAGNAAAVTVDVGVDQSSSEDPAGRLPSTLRNAIVTLPEGLTINPGVARDLTACSDSAFGKNSGAPAQCPASSKVGTAGIQTPLLANPLPGDIYIGEPKPGEMFRLFVYADGQGARIKLEGTVTPDPQTGQLKATFYDNPPLPFSNLRLRFQGGGRSVLALPETCGSKVTNAGFSGWSGAVVNTASSFLVFADEQGNPCPESQPFSPSFVAGTTSNNAGGDTGFTLTVRRNSNEQQLKSLKADLPAGLLGRLADFPLCPIAQAEANQCSESSLVGGLTVSAGAGDSVLNLPGRAYLTEPPKPGQIAGLAFIVPAQVGPYDLGTVVVKAGITVNRDTSLSVESDPFPTILGGVPLRLRQVTVTLDRPGFMFNPTDCSPKTIGGHITSVGGAMADVASPFQVSGCAALAFAPEVKLATAQPKQQGGNTGLRVEITPRTSDANMRVVDLILPAGMGARLDGPIQHPCKADELAKDACPAASRVGDATAVTPVLPQPLSGSVYLLENGMGGGLPRLAIQLRGMVAVDLVGDITLNDSGRIVAHVPGVPDVPISSFVMNLESGDQAALTANNLCQGTAVAYRSIVAHNGQQSHGTLPVEVTGCAAKSKAKTPKKAKGKHGKGKKGGRA